VSPLRKAGLIVSRHGVHGGYELTRAPGEITMREVMRVLEGPLAPMVCATEGERDEFCIREDFCGTRTLWMRIRESIATALESMTLADLAPQGGMAVRAREFRSLAQLPQVQAECADQQVVNSATPGSATSRATATLLRPSGPPAPQPPAPPPGRSATDTLPDTWLAMRATIGLDLAERRDLQVQALGNGPHLFGLDQGLATATPTALSQYPAAAAPPPTSPPPCPARSWSESRPSCSTTRGAECRSWR